MNSKTEKTKVEGGWVARDAKTGRFVMVKSGKTTAKASARTISQIKDVSQKRSAALKRLVNR